MLLRQWMSVGLSAFSVTIMYKILTELLMQQQLERRRKRCYRLQRGKRVLAGLTQPFERRGVNVDESGRDLRKGKGLRCDVRGCDVFARQTLGSQWMKFAHAITV